MRDLGIRLLRFFIRRAESYTLLKPLLSLYFLREGNEAFRRWVLFLLGNLREAHRHSKPVIYSSAFFPTELIYALGAVPFLPEIFAAVVAYFDWSRRPIAVATGELSSDLCSFHRSVMGLARESFLPPPDLVISSSQICDGANKFFSCLAHLYSVPHLLLDPPYHGEEAARGYLISQMREVFYEASRLLGIRPDEGRLSQALRLAVEARSFIERVNELRRAIPAPFPGSEGLSYVAGMNFYSLGSPEGVRFFRALSSHIERRVKEGKGYLPQERYRLLWLHHIRPYYPNGIFRVLEERGAAVVFEEPNYLFWPPPDPERPWESLADKVLSNPWTGPLSRRIRMVEEMIEEYRVDGVIHFSHWGCRQSSGGAGVIGDVLKRKGIPYLILPGDGADPDNYSPGQTRTRLEAFLEMLAEVQRG